MTKIRLPVLCFLLSVATSFSYPQQQFNSSATGNPLLPGYFADPTVKKFGDFYYIYATADGIKLASGEPQVWISKDFKNWTNRMIELDIPQGLNNCWAPDVVCINNKYYYFMGNCERGCNIYGYVSDSPTGPFKPIKDGNPVIPAGTSRENLPALDAQYLMDDDGSVYSYFGTWCTSFGGMGVVKVDPQDMFTIQKTGFIPINQIPKAFEAAYPLKHNGKYFLMYSSGDCRLSSYAVHYSVGDSPMGPFRPGKNSPILSSNQDGTIDGPGHHSVLKVGDQYYIVYHRHDNPHSTNGEFRQVCVDQLVFSNDSTLEKVIPTHVGINLPSANEALDYAYRATATASSTYRLKSLPTVYSPAGHDYLYSPENVTDRHNGTLWKAAKAATPQWITIDLKTERKIEQILTEFEYPTWYYQYKIEVSKDNIHWNLFADRTANRTPGCPMVDSHSATARYIKLTVTGTQKQGVIPAIWNIKVYGSPIDLPEVDNKPSSEGPAVRVKGELLVSLDATTIPLGKVKSLITNQAALKGHFINHGTPIVENIQGKKAIRFDGNSYLKLSVKAPLSLSWNSPYTVSVWVLNPGVGLGECLVAWNSRENMLQSSYAALMYGKSNFGAMAHGDGAVDLPFKSIPERGKWHQVTVTFDGALENVYVDGKLNTQQPLTLYVQNGDILIGASGEESENLTGYIASAKLYNKALTSAEVNELFQKSSSHSARKQK